VSGLNANDVQLFAALMLMPGLVARLACTSQERHQSWGVPYLVPRGRAGEATAAPQHQVQNRTSVPPYVTWASMADPISVAGTLSPSNNDEPQILFVLSSSRCILGEVIASRRSRESFAECRVSIPVGDKALMLF